MSKTELQESISTLSVNRSFVPGDDYRAIPCGQSGCDSESEEICEECTEPRCHVHMFSPVLCRDCRIAQAEEAGEIICAECCHTMNNGDGYGDPQRPVCGACKEAQDDWEVANAR